MRSSTEVTIQMIKMKMCRFYDWTVRYCQPHSNAGNNLRLMVSQMIFSFLWLLFGLWLYYPCVPATTWCVTFLGRAVGGSFAGQAMLSAVARKHFSSCIAHTWLIAALFFLDAPSPFSALALVYAVKAANLIFKQEKVAVISAAVLSRAPQAQLKIWDGVVQYLGWIQI